MLARLNTIAAIREELRFVAGARVDDFGGEGRRGGVREACLGQKAIGRKRP